MSIARAHLGSLPGAPRREWLASGSSPPIVDTHTNPRNLVGNITPDSNGQGMLPMLCVFLIEKYDVVNYC